MRRIGGRVVADVHRGPSGVLGGSRTLLWLLDSAMVAGPLPGMASSEMPHEDLWPPPCIIDWSDQVAKAEEDLANAVVVSVISDGPLAAVEEVAALVAARIDVVASSLVLRRASPSSYLLVLPSLTLVERLVGLRQPISSSGFNFSLLCKHWSHLSRAQGRVLPFLIDIELRGIANHVWETSTVEHLLGPHAWVQQVHPDTRGLVDLSCFRCLAWSTNPTALPWVVEPPTAVAEDPPVKRVLAYPVNIQYSLHPSTLHGPSDGGDVGEDDSTRQRRRVLSPPPPPSSSPWGGYFQPSRRFSVRDGQGATVVL